jgi:hypothetical protein
MASSETTPRHDTNSKPRAAKDRRTMLSTVWLFLVLSFIYADVFTLFFDKGAGTAADMNAGAIFFFAVVMETAVAMVVLCRVLPQVWNRWTNVGVAILQIAVLGWSMVGEPMTPFYAFFSAVEMATLLFVAGYAFTWRSQRQSAPVAVTAGV